MTDGALVERLRITQLPAIVVIVEERILHYRDVWQARAIRIFARNSIPSTFLVHISNYDALRRFVDQWFTSNKVENSANLL